MANTRKRRIDEARIQRAINGLKIPMLQIVPLYAKLQRELDNGATDSALHATAKLFVEPQLCSCTQCALSRSDAAARIIDAAKLGYAP